MGLDVAGYPADAWILHAMYESTSLPSTLTHDEVYRAQVANGDVSPTIINGVRLDSTTTVIGCPLGRSSAPEGPDWQRLRWQDLAGRTGVRLGHPLCFRTFHSAWPSGSWPINIRPPAEGSLDREQLGRLIELLAQRSVEGPMTPCECYYSTIATRPLGEAVYEMSLKEVLQAYDNPSVIGTPSNCWPTDRSWLVYTDSDLWATKVSGEARLIEQIIADPALEAIRLPREGG